VARDYWGASEGELDGPFEVLARSAANPKQITHGPFFINQGSDWRIRGGKPIDASRTSALDGHRSVYR